MFFLGFHFRRNFLSYHSIYFVLKKYQRREIFLFDKTLGLEIPIQFFDLKYAYLLPAIRNISGKVGLFGCHFFARTTGSSWQGGLRHVSVRPVPLPRFAHTMIPACAVWYRTVRGPPVAVDSGTVEACAGEEALREGHIVREKGTAHIFLTKDLI